MDKAEDEASKRHQQRQDDQRAPPPPAVGIVADDQRPQKITHQRDRHQRANRGGRETLTGERDSQHDRQQPIGALAQPAHENDSPTIAHESLLLEEI